MMTEYRPVACSFHDQLEHLAMRRVRCRIQVRENGVDRVIEARIKDIRTTKGAEYLVLDGEAGLVRLDHILEIGAADDQPL